MIERINQKCLNQAGFFWKVRFQTLAKSAVFRARLLDQQGVTGVRHYHAERSPQQHWLVAARAEQLEAM